MAYYKPQLTLSLATMRDSNTYRVINFSELMMALLYLFNLLSYPHMKCSINGHVCNCKA